MPAQRCAPDFLEDVDCVLEIEISDLLGLVDEVEREIPNLSGFEGEGEVALIWGLGGSN